MAMTSLLPSVVVVVVVVMMMMMMMMMMNCNGNKIGKLSDRHQRWSAMKVVMN